MLRRMDNVRLEAQGRAASESSCYSVSRSPTMRRPLRRAAHLLACLILVSCHSVPADPVVDRWPVDPLRGELIWSDVALFWEAFDRVTPDGPNPFGPGYLDVGSIGLHDFVPSRIEGPDELLAMVRAERAYYESVRDQTLDVAHHEKQIRAAYAALKYWYPEACFPPVYFVIGRTTSGGTASDNGLIIGLEIFGAEPTETTYGRPSMDSSLIPYIVAHEIVHFFQPAPAERTLLSRCLHEGAADFVGELISGARVRELNGPDVYPYGEAHEQELWREFSERRSQPDTSGWLYSATEDGRPQNLGYWMGYRIVQAFFERAPDKREAIRAILNATEDAEDFLHRSGYPIGSSKA